MKSVPTFTTTCSGDFGIEVQGRIVAQAFVHLDYNEPPLYTYSLHVYDLIAGGPHKVLDVASGLNELLRLTKVYQKNILFEDRREWDAGKRNLGTEVE